MNSIPLWVITQMGRRVVCGLLDSRIHTAHTHSIHIFSWVKIRNNITENIHRVDTVVGTSGTIILRLLYHSILLFTGDIQAG